ncbi:MAG TPA: methyl-accepting chemotaxis protein [Thermoanaerobaculia bacterium]|nr:methyl-accepting chemotaxis protein [Thermoanaerobaculia bacterium]
MAVNYLRPSAAGLGVSSASRYPLFIVFPPLAVLLPLALAFLAHVLRLDAAEAARIGAFAAVAYGAGSIAFVIAIARRSREVEMATENAGEAVSRCLRATEFGALLLWLAGGSILAIAGTIAVAPSLAGLQYFGEAALIIAAPAMAWSYWAGKQMLLSMARGTEIDYRGNPYSIAVKIAMVFIGFFVVSVGALVLLVSSHVASRLREAGVAAGSIVADLTRYGLVIALLTAVVFAVATFFLARDITAPLNELIHIAREMAEGHFDVSPHVFSDDEIGKLARSFGATRNSLRSLLSRIGSSGADITQGVRAMSSGTTALLSGAHEQQDLNAAETESVRNVSGEARSVLQAVDKVTGVSYESASAATQMNASSTEVAHRMDDLFRSVEKTSSSTLEIDAIARETSRRTNDLTAVSSDVLTFVTEMDASVGEIMRTAHATADLSAQVHNDAVAGQRAVSATTNGIRTTQESTRRAVDAFEELQGSLSKIHQIVEFIESVTDEAKLLSFNAAIIAAHAGEHDYGFSVIAEEVRKLSERTRNAAGEIGGIVRNLRPVAQQAVAALEDGVANVGQTVDLASQAAASLNKIVTSADRSQEIVLTISSAIEEQAMASKHLRDLTARVSDTIRDIDRANETQAEATRLLAEEAEHVRDIAQQVNRSTEEQRIAAGGIATAMENISGDVRVIRDRLERQLVQAEQIATASVTTLSIAQKNSAIAEDFKRELEGLFASATAFEEEVARFRV